MADIVLFGATGYTGKLTAEALGRRGASFAVAGRNRTKLEALAERTSASDVHVAEVGDVDSLVRALRGGRVLLTCVGPFTQLGSTAVEAALTAGTHYLDSAGESGFITSLIEQHGSAARAAGIAMAPAMGFDEVPADVAATRATAGMEEADLVLTYAFPSHGSSGTIRTILTNIVGGRGRWIDEGAAVEIRAGHRHRWAPMPPPLGPRPSISFDLAEGRLAPLHLSLRSLQTFVTAGRLQHAGVRFGAPAIRTLMSMPGAPKLIEKLLPTGVGPGEEARLKGGFTILAEARAAGVQRNVAVMGKDTYGLTAELLATGALTMATDGFSGAGVLAPVQAAGLETLQDEMERHGVTIQVFE
ncbi:MAG: trans-acting enoyl reductase family protein [Actinomycetota bacterium]